ncbi:MAG: STAS domain-containing protein [Phycisphaera sp.]|nr:STAS domain-containing protein [Phycisphaera sp.]
MSNKPSQGLVLNIRHELDSVTVSLIGDGSNIFGQRIRDELTGVTTHPPKHVVFDLSELTFINSVLVGVIVEFVVRLQREGTKLELCEAKGQVLEVLRNCNVERLLRFEKA